MKKLLLIAFLTFTASFTPIAAKFAVKEISPLSLAFFRFGTAAFLLLIFFLFRKHSFKIDKADIWKMLLLGALVIPINQFCFLVGISLSSASHSGVFYACTPLFVYVTSILIKNEDYKFSKLLYISLSVIGILIIFSDNLLNVKQTGEDVIIGDTLLFFAVLSWSLYLTFSKSMVAKYGALKTSTLSFLIGIVLFIPMFLNDLPNLSFDNITSAGILGFIHLTVLVAFGSYFLYSYSTKLISTSTLTTLTNASPIITVAAAWLMLNESFTDYFIIGAVITFIGVFLAQRTDKKSRGPGTPL